MTDTDSAIGRARPYDKTDLVLIIALLVIATAIRLLYLQLIPVFTDEAFEVLAAYSIYQGEFTAFGPVNPTAGPLFAYLVALSFWLLGPQFLLPRILVMTIGVLTVGLTYVLGRSIGGRWAGAIAGALLAFSPVHTIVNSHIAWSNSTTPFFITLAFIVLHRSLRRKNGPLLVLGGFLYGLSLQTHVSMLVVAPGLVVWFLARRDILNLLRKPWPYLAGGAALLGYLNMIIFNLMTRGGSLTDVQNHDYAWVAEPTWAIYWTNIKNMVVEVGPTFGGMVPRISDPMSALVAGLLLIWLVVALIYAAGRRETMPLLVVLSTALIMPYFNRRYAGLLSQRYVSFLLPICFSAMGFLAADAIGSLRRQGSPPTRVMAAGSMVLVILLALYPVRNTLTHYAIETQAGRDNSLSLSMAMHLSETLPADSDLFLSSHLRGSRGDGGYRYLRSLFYALVLEGKEPFVLDLPDIVTRLESDQAGETWLVLPPDDYETLSQRFELKRIEGSPKVHNDGMLVRYVSTNP
ncbi:ArnT family glycosyltransferase [Chloroflexota bacterium]